MTDTNPNRLVWTEIPVTDLKQANIFYETVLKAPLTEDDQGPQTMLMLPGMSDNGPCGHLYQGKPVTAGDGITAHLAIDGELADAMERVKGGGGKVISDIITIPAGSFFYATDPDGNSLGIFKY
ncbi:VOC family protein [Parasphingorhabdus sp.]|uniref:VOC family protein n=1 Tax=Parasphingorhabdus sp. TaxID=2709688 RepID=UPI0032674DA8